MASHERPDSGWSGISLNVEDKLSRVRFNVDAAPHIVVALSICKTCQNRPCLYVCPVKNYTIEDKKFVFSWQGCLECGACRVVCPNKAVEWQYPRGGFGVCFRYG